MAFMIFSASSKSYPDSSLANSLTSSYISTDSAIAGCNNSEKSDKRYKDAAVQQQQQQQNRETASYGQFYFAKDSNISANYNAINERTPLVSACAIVKQSPVIIDTSSTNKQLHQQTKYDIPAQVDRSLSDSVSLTLGIAIKNSTCLVKNIDDHFACGDGCCEKPHKNELVEENWVSSKWILVPMLPLTLGMKVLTPCKFKNTCWTIWTFLVSIALIGGLTYISVWMVHSFGQSVGIPETVAGMTILSWGTGIPELIASIVLIKKTAQADMAICNTIGSNVIDISFCLSLPW